MRNYNHEFENVCLFWPYCFEIDREKILGGKQNRVNFVLGGRLPAYDRRSKMKLNI